MRTISWLLLALVGLATLLGSLASAYVAYGIGQDQFGTVSLSELAAGRAEVASVLRARRGTAAAYAAGFAILFLSIVLIPYRRGEVWSWWAILEATLATAVIILARILFLGIRTGAGTAWILLGVVGLALLLDIKRLWA